MCRLIHLRLQKRTQGRPKKSSRSDESRKNSPFLPTFSTHWSRLPRTASRKRRRRLHLPSTNSTKTGRRLRPMPWWSTSTPRNVTYHAMSFPKCSKPQTNSSSRSSPKGSRSKSPSSHTSGSPSPPTRIGWPFSSSATWPIRWNVQVSLPRKPQLPHSQAHRSLDPAQLHQLFFQVQPRSVGHM